VKNVLTEEIFCLEKLFLWCQFKRQIYFFLLVFFQKIFSSPTSMETLGNQIQQNSAKKYHCVICNYNTDRKCNYDTHLISKRHVTNSANGNHGNQIQQQFSELNYSCQNCKKKFTNRSGLWKHKKICVTESITEYKKDEPTDKQLFMMLLQQNSELIKEHSDLKELILEIVKNGTHNTTTTHTNSHNKAFNLQFFLNETCKNAMNITDFVESIKLQLSDFMNIGEVGFVEGISNIIVKNLNSLDETVRPIHCTDQKRETFYVKDQNIWEKEEEDKKKLHRMIKSIAFKNENLMKNYKEKYPDYNDPDSHRSDQYSKTVIEAMDSKEESREKIIRNLSKATKINGK
jgi:DNA-binding ferritin-like protein